MKVNTKKAVWVVSIIVSVCFLVWSVCVVAKVFANPMFASFWWLSVEQASMVAYPVMAFSGFSFAAVVVYFKGFFKK
ncbi:MAG: hypothetical protein WC325_13330 [Candidatus Bathyarchaeia archaeon]